MWSLCSVKKHIGFLYTRIRERTLPNIYNYGWRVRPKRRARAAAAGPGLWKLCEQSPAGRSGGSLIFGTRCRLPPPLPACPRSPPKLAHAHVHSLTHTYTHSRTRTLTHTYPTYPPTHPPATATSFSRTSVPTRVTLHRSRTLHAQPIASASIPKNTRPNIPPATPTVSISGGWVGGGWVVWDLVGGIIMGGNLPRVARTAFSGDRDSGGRREYEMRACCSNIK